MSWDGPLFLAGLSAAAVMGAIPLKGLQSRILWALALAFGVLALVSIKAQKGSPVDALSEVLWGASPFIGVGMMLLVSQQRELIPRREILGPPPTPNPALTTDYLWTITRGATALEAKRKLAAHRNQLATLKGQVKDIDERWGGLKVHVSGLGYNEFDHPMPMEFKKGQAALLEAIKPGEWIEFRGIPDQSTAYGWTLIDCQFIARADPPKPPSRRGKAQRQP